MSPRARAGILLGAFFAAGYVIAALLVLATTHTPEVGEIPLGARVWMLPRLVLGPFLSLRNVSGAGTIIVASVVIVLLGIVFPRVLPVRILACLASFLWPLWGVLKWATMVA